MKMVIFRNVSFQPHFIVLGKLTEDGLQLVIEHQCALVD